MNIQDIKDIRQALREEHTASVYYSRVKKTQEITDTGIQHLQEGEWRRDEAGNIVPNFIKDGYGFYFEEQFGGEGMGDDYWIVFSVRKDDEKRFFKIPGYYASHYGSEIDLDDTFEVAAIQKVVTVWEKASS